MSAAAQVVDLGLKRLVALERRVGKSKSSGLRARWEFGHELLAARDGKGRLPNGYLTRVVEETGASRAELTYRAQFAERFPTEDQLFNAIEHFGSWFRIVKEALPARGDSGEPPGEPGELPEGAFRVIAADPPWQYGNKATRGAAEDHYTTLTIPQLCGNEPMPDGSNLAEEVETRAADAAHLYLWVTNGFLREGFGVVEAWGFTYKTCLTWIKPQMGLGNYFRSSTEHVLFGVRGGMRLQDKALMNWFEAPRAKHSKKPDCFFELVEKASTGPVPGDVLPQPVRARPSPLAACTRHRRKVASTSWLASSWR